LVEPRSIAIVGLSANPEKHGARVLASLRRFGYSGEVFGVNPRGGELHGVTTYPSLRALPTTPDAVVLAVPAAQVLTTLEAAGEIGAGGAILFGGGFAETGPEGAALQERIRECARESGLRLLGPNSAGLINPTSRVVMSFLTCLERPADQLRAGPVALVTQSGGSASFMHNVAAARGSGLAVTISTGNEAGVRAGEALGFLVQQPYVRVVAMLLETIRDGAQFLASAQAAVAAGKPVVVCKIGRSAAGARMMLTHTGALAAPQRRLDAVFDSLGITVTSTPEELFDVAELLARSSIPDGDRVGVVTHSGGAAVLLADKLDAAGLDLPQPSAELSTALQPYLQLGAPGNPTDLGGIITEPQRYTEVVHRFIDEPSFDTVVAVSTPHPPAHTAGRADELIRLSADSRKPLLNLWWAGDIGAIGRQKLTAAGVPVTTDVDALAIAAGGLARFGRRCRGGNVAVAPPDPAVVAWLQDRSAAGSSATLTEVDGKELLRRMGLPVLRGEFVRTAAQAQDAADRIGFPVVVKAVSPDLAHKSDVGAVRLDLRDREAVERAVLEIGAAVESAAAAAIVDGYLVEEFAPGLEMVLGVVRDPTFGPFVIVGTGGVYAEALDDVALGLAPLSVDQAGRLVRSLRGHRLLEGFRGSPPADEQALVNLVVTLSGLAASYADYLAEADLNPLIFSGGAWRVADALVRLAPDTPPNSRSTR
jgi:acyl-CoA synthetase (NDP forming)